MDNRTKIKVAVLAVAGAAAIATGTGFAASKLAGSPSEESQAVIDDAAKQLGVSSSALSSALKTALKNRVDAAVAAGRLTQAQGDELKQRIDSSGFPLVGGFGLHHGFGVVGHGLDAAASYLGLTETELRTQLESGKSLAQIAKDRGKSVDGLVNALYDEAKTHLDAAVSAGRLTQDQETQILAELKQRVTDMVNGILPAGPGPRFHDDRGAPGPFGP